MATSSMAYARNAKPLTERKQPRIEKNISKIEPKKIGVGLVAGCCLALLTYISLAKLFSIYSPVFGKFFYSFLNFCFKSLFYFFIGGLIQIEFIVSCRCQRIIDIQLITLDFKFKFEHEFISTKR